ncbi:MULTISPECIES: hypothetical protein [Streptomyces]|uniref:Uncharacterized protein n=1 Tax=Streptomyces plicatus TaxID=1922 RepID=A0ABW1Y4I2_STRPL|nr:MULTISPECIES: hypothetical protein [Streptomyces]MBJ6622179.1 hypothetical protein [Streptomyces sp. DHE17-7]RIH60571.1 hypothetical protein D3C59_17855 [Streptomyces sp. SHP22-7]
MTAQVVERGMKAWNEDAAPVVYGRLTGAYWLTDADDADCSDCRDLLDNSRGDADRASGGREAGAVRERAVLVEQARMVMVAAAAVTVVAALVLASG